MPLFQSSVLNKYLSEQDTIQLQERFEACKQYFGNTSIQQNIISSKEEEFQEGFLRELFVNILGYTINPDPQFNLRTELKNIKDSKKADGAIVNNTQVLCVIELKGAETINLGKIENQAFGYKNNQTDCRYVITSNFQKLRFYIDNAVEFLEWNLFNLDLDAFRLLYLCLNKVSIFNNLPAIIKEESLVIEQAITKKLYKEYSDFRRALYTDISNHNPEIDKLLIFKKTQKLLDRFLFLFFAEDRMLVPPNSVRTILNQWTELKEKFEVYQPLYDRFKKYFGYLNTGHSGKLHDIFAYNGGLFANDEILDSIKINDTLLFEGALRLSNYNYNSEVDVNILGHIFEHSLTEIEELEQEIINIGEDAKKSNKRKKDGVYYTPKYITKYIVENTVGTLCKNKKNELELIEEEYLRGGRNVKTQKPLLAKLYQYKEWLLQITIIDPACGSGAFLNQALEFLINEHNNIAFLESVLTKRTHADESVRLLEYGVESHILENNLFGVDINEESIDIAKLSLWLRTARKGRKLNSLSNNIKCGNSLIDDASVAGEKAFNWLLEFPHIFEKGGFDVVIGNPPYLRVQGLRANFEKETPFYENTYQSASGRFDFYVLFLEKANQLINLNGIVSFILPHKFLISDFGSGIRGFLKNSQLIKRLIHFGSEEVFADVSTYTCIVSLSRDNQHHFLYKKIKPSQLFEIFEFDKIIYKTLSQSKWNLNTNENYSVLEKLKKQPHTVKQIFEHVSQGIVSVGDDIFLLKGEIIGSQFKGFSEKLKSYVTFESGVMKPLLKGEDVKRYSSLRASYYCIYPHNEIEGKTVPFEESYFRENFPLAYNYILQYKDELIEKKIRYKTNPKAWYSLHRSREIALFEQIKIVTPETSLGGNMTLDTSNFYHNTQVYSLELKPIFKIDYKYILAILNSNLFWFYLKTTGAVLRGGYFRFKTKYLEPFPIPLIPKNQNSFIECVDELFLKTTEFQAVLQNFIDVLSSKFDKLKINTKLNKWVTLNFSDFNKELINQKIKLSLQETSEWLQFFEQEKQKAVLIQNRMEKDNEKINTMVYDLYTLTKEEVLIVEA